MAVSQQFAAIRSVHRQASALANVPSSLEPVHSQFVAATSDCDRMTILVAQGLDTGEVSRINEGSVYLRQCAEKVEKAAELIPQQP